MGSVATIYKRELKTYFTSPIAYIFIIAFLVVMAVYFFAINGFFQQPNPDLRSYFAALPLAFVILIPAVTMRLWSEEKKTGTVEVLMTLPLRSWEIVLGKFLAGYTVVAVTLLLTFVVPFSIQFVVDLDWGVVVSSYIGAFVLAGVYIAVGSWVSAVTENQIVALLVSMVLLLILWGASLPQVAEVLNGLVGGLGNVLSWFGTYSHYQNFVKGLINPVDLIYAASMMVFFLILNNFAVEWRKY
jgi:ABC-2 type transport system permease protein